MNTTFQANRYALPCVRPSGLSSADSCRSNWSAMSRSQRGIVLVALYLKTLLNSAGLLLLVTKMRRSIIDCYRSLAVCLVMSPLLTAAPAFAAEDECQASGGYQYICGPQSAEDLVQVPETEFIIASGYGAGVPFYLIDAKGKSWSQLHPAVAGVGPDAGPFAACPAAPDFSKLVTHGLNIRQGKDGHSTLYVVGHGAREAIEVFAVDASGGSPVLTWKGCIVMPQGLVANSVASFADGSLLATVPLYSGKTITDAMAGQSTGAVYAWSPGDAGFTLIQGTELPYANGIEVSDDGTEFYVVSSGAFTVGAYTRSNPSRLLRTSRPMAIVPDNLHRGPDGQLLTAGLVLAHPDCGTIGGSQAFSLKEFAACPRPFIVNAIDPQSMAIREVASGPANANFSNVTMALPVGKELWIGTFAGNRIAYRALH